MNGRAEAWLNRILAAVDYLAGNVRVKLGDSAGATKLSIRDSSDTEVAYIDSDGNISGLTVAGYVVANPAITPATKTKITYDAKGLVTAGADATTADIADSTNKRYVTDAELAVLAVTSGVNTGDQVVPVNSAAVANNFLTAYNNTTGAWTRARPAWANIDKTTSDIADITTKSHTSLSDIGTNTHAQIDTALTRLANTSGTNTGDQSGANPTASVGLAAVNGSASTFMRSDGAPALSQSIAPTWTAVHTFSLAPTMSAGVNVGTGSGAAAGQVIASNSQNSALISSLTNANAGSSASVGLQVISDTVTGNFRAFSAAAGGGARLNVTSSSGYMLLGTLTSDPLAIYTNNAERVAITALGAVLVGRTVAVGTDAAGNAEIAGKLRVADQITSELADGTAPFVVTSTTVVANLKAATVATNANLTGPITSVGNATSIAAQTGTGTTFVMSAAPTIAGGAITALTTLAVRDTSAAFDVTLAATSSTTLTAGRTLTLDVVNAARTLKLAANLTVSATADVSGTNTGDQTITLTGGVTGSGTGSFAATVITNANLTGPITSTGNATAIASQTGTGTKFVMDTAPTIAGGVHTGITSLGIRDTSAAFDVTLAAVSSTTLTAGRTLTIDVVNAARTFKLAANLTVSATADVSGTNTGDQSAANPTGTAGLSAVNGSASTWMRSDGAPAISQSITPTWSAAHTFSLSPTMSTGINVGTATGAGTGIVIIKGATTGSDIIQAIPATGALGDAGYISVNSRARFGFDGSGNVVIDDEGTTKNILLKTGSTPTTRLTIASTGAVTVAGAFACNGATAQTAAASGGALAAYAAGANGLSTGANMSALHALVVAMRAALVANGVMS